MTDVEIRDENVRAAAAEFIRQRLALGGSLGRLLLGTADFEGGKVAALSAGPLEAGDVAQFGRGHARVTNSQPQSITIAGKTYAAYPTPTASERLTDTIYRLLRSQADLCLFENVLARAGDPSAARARSHLLFHGSEVYHAVFGADRDKATIINAIREAESLPVFFGALGRSPRARRAETERARNLMTRTPETGP